MPSQWLVFILMLFTQRPGKLPEATEETTYRYATIADAIHRASNGDPEMELYLTATTFHESGWKLPVHDGTKRGDGGRSWCLGQILLGRNSPRGMELVGTDPASTERCLETSARYLRHGTVVCRGWDDPACIWKVYGGVKSAMDPRIQRRVTTYRKLKRLRCKLTE